VEDAEARLLDFFSGRLIYHKISAGKLWITDTEPETKIL